MQPEAEPAAPVRTKAGLAGFVAVCYLAGFYASLYAPSMAGEWGWYPRLSKPSWTPSPAVTGPVWTILYGCMAVAGWRVWRLGGFRLVPIAGIGFGLQLLLQASWSTLFYGAQSTLAGLVDLVCLLSLVATLWFTYKSIDKLAGRLWLPYFLWLTYLTAVHWVIWWRNGSVRAQ
jgi:tryptophan-rich sensory protein